MTTRFLPTLDDIIMAALVGIANHPYIKTPRVYYPVPTGNEPLIVPIADYRDTAGLNIDAVTDGVTLSIYPLHSARKNASASPPNQQRTLSVTYKPHTMGKRNDLYSLDEAIYRLIVEVAYEDSGLNVPVPITFTELDYPDIWESNHAYKYMLGDHDPNDPGELGPQYDQRLMIPNIKNLTVRTRPGERVIRQYIDILRLVLQDLPTLQPLAIRHTQVLSCDFHTTNWLRDGADVYFHSAYLTWEVCAYLPNSLRVAPPIYKANISS